MHPITIGAPRDILGLGRKPVVLQRSDEDFVDATLDDLRTADGRAGLAAMRAQATDASGTLKLFQPIQRQFHVAVIESWCETPGQPRLDPARVDSAGLVLRRIRADGSLEGWMRSSGRVRGWVPTARSSGDIGDPLAALREQRGLVGVPDIDRQLVAYSRLQPDNLLDEHVVSMYLAPPDVCADASRTYLYGIVPTVSSELSETDATFAPADGFDFGPQSTAFTTHLVLALQGQAMALPNAGQQVSASWMADPDSAEAQDSTLSRFVLLLRQLGNEFNAFDGGAEVAALQQRLRAITLPMVVQAGDTQQRSVNAWEFLSAAKTVLIDGGSVSGGVQMPATWPALSDNDAAALRTALHDALQARYTSVAGKTGRFDDPAARYVLRAFVRLKPDEDCGSRIVWSDYGDPFVIAAWYENGGARPAQILLPDPSDRKLMAALKPGVAFVVPPSLQSLLKDSTKDLLAGNGTSSGLGLTWICGFNIPIITICAFIVLNIFLSLFNLVFGWLFFMKICLPFPKIPPKV
jgi:hypothetical protein